MIRAMGLVKTIAVMIVLIFAIFPIPLKGHTEDLSAGSDQEWTIYYRPEVRFGTDDRTLYINDFLVPFYRDDKNILFSNIRFTPNDHDGWEVNLGLGYRRFLFDDKLALGINAFYDQRKMPRGTILEQWGVGAEIMAEVPMGETDLGLTGRFNYYRPLSDAEIYIGPNRGYGNLCTISFGNNSFTNDWSNYWSGNYGPGNQIYWKNYSPWEQ